MVKKSRTTAFADWIHKQGVPSVATTCKVTERTVYYWLAGKVKPSDSTCEIIVGAAPHLSLADIKGIR